MLRGGKITMNMFIRAYNNRGKQFDLNIGPKCCLTFEKMADSAKQQLTLPPEIISSSPTLNEVYLSFMDPNGEIVAFDLIEHLHGFHTDFITERLYFQVGQERRELKLESVIWFTDKLDMEEVECDTEMEPFNQDEMSGDFHMGFFRRKNPRGENPKDILWPKHCIKGDNPKTEEFAPFSEAVILRKGDAEIPNYTLDRIVTDGKEFSKEEQQIVQHELMHLKAQIEQMKGEEKHKTIEQISKELDERSRWEWTECPPEEKIFQ